MYIYIKFIKCTLLTLKENCNEKKWLGYIGLSVACCCISCSQKEEIKSSVKSVVIGGIQRTIPLYDLAQSEKERINGFLGDEANASLAGQLRNSDLPKSASVQNKMTPVKDQGNRGTCSVFAAVALMEFDTNLDLSEQCLAYFAGKQDPGHISQRLEYAILHGLYFEETCPYKDERKIPNITTDTEADLGRSAELLPETTFQSLSMLRERIVRGIPVGISVYVTNSEWYNNDDTIIDISTSFTRIACTNTCGGHAIVAVAYDDISQTITFKNSWGTNWKNRGYGRITYRYFFEAYMGGLANQMVALH